MSNNTNLYDFYNNNNNNSIVDKGIKNDNLFIYSKNEELYVIENDIRCFMVSFRRLRNILQLKLNSEVKNILINNISNIKIKKKNENSHFLIIKIIKKITFSYSHNVEIKLKEINDFINIYSKDNESYIINKLFEKINILSKKINEYENKFKEPTTDDEIFICY